ncbi:Lead, cadmium, zinc and mercury-transporting ATPase [Vibrio nigripulchritudo MADA3029]|uniref:zinc/cadmium/mercury/lead-transporting ATPase n=1 Tax=Vibrio nigripulchritudo TaxID=28173 RepID=UPI0003B19BD9|nr:zinc/cadmium/mercury/lead-transporting ATPase [Vibrio nigripulchritudo]CCN49317.1 Lead, cadmium, zinc and mercury-transporting ATPase [Vibrio nigripulchritudo MADA3020]CCN51632.1 Lead, cadmium, zinc and mercury-transporting ATPase [Vibrio nigripulchritudo MADA3021]CCN57314.1 Lead, cadmium, zinc and mercury-transporting ATPase [Vibrio nigripulchritudo MADA3029]
MCIKHESCKSKHTGPTLSISSCTPIAPLESNTESGHCCNSDSCSGGGETASIEDEGERSPGSDTLSGSWKILGMDCPSCARKVENAVSAIKDVSHTKVLFATEKLVVQYQEATTLPLIEQAVRKAGFQFGQPKKQVESETTENRALTFLKANLNIISLSAAMAISAIINQVSPQVGAWMFTFVCIAGLYPVARKAIQLAKSGTPFAIETLMSVAALGALYLGETIEAAMVLLLFLLGERLEAYAASRARSGVQSLMALVPENTIRIENDLRVEVAASELSVGDIIEVVPGDRLPADGKLVDTNASFDESALTGESVPVGRDIGDQVMAGSVVVDKVVRLSITSEQGENAIDRILHLIEEAESRKAPLERFLDKFSRWYTPLMMVVSLLVIITPPLFFEQPWETWVYRGLALLLIACPCALVISTPAAITSGLATAAKRGALIKGGAALEQLGKIEAVAFDKTGTLTLGKPQVTDVKPVNELDTNTLLTLAAAIEVGSSHPLAKSLVQKAESSGLVLPEAKNKQAQIGSGISGEVDGKPVILISPSKFQGQVSSDLKTEIESLESRGKTVVLVSVSGALEGLIAWQDTLRDDAAPAIEKLKKLGIDSVMLTGDNPLAAKEMASKVAMDFKASLLPADKVSYVNELAQHKHVAMVGDGINDAPAMKAASVGIAMGGGTDVALETADAALTHSRLEELPAMIELSKATLRNIQQNVALALGLKGVFLFTSLFGITGLWVAVLADSGATALVTLNALRLLRFTPKD